jgi:hypothetical protein
MKKKWEITAITLTVLCTGVQAADCRDDDQSKAKQVCTGVQAADCRDDDQSKAKQVAQKLDLLTRLLDDSEPLRRTQEDGNAEALLKIPGRRTHGTR